MVSTLLACSLCTFVCSQISFFSHVTTYPPQCLFRSFCFLLWSSCFSYTFLPASTHQPPLAVLLSSQCVPSSAFPSTTLAHPRAYPCSFLLHPLVRFPKRSPLLRTSSFAFRWALPVRFLRGSLVRPPCIPCNTLEFYLSSLLLRASQPVRVDHFG